MESAGYVVCPCGCKTPVVLRLRSGGTNKVVTFTYTQDIMKREFLRDQAWVQKEFVHS